MEKGSLHLPEIGDMILFPYWEAEKDNYFLVLSEPKGYDNLFSVFKAWDARSGETRRIFCYSDRQNNNTHSDENVWRYLDSSKDR